MGADEPDEARRNRFAWGPGDLVKCEPEFTDAAAMAQKAGVQLNDFVAALTDAKLRWQPVDSRWMVQTHSLQHSEMKRILASLVKQGP